MLAHGLRVFCLHWAARFSGADGKQCLTHVHPTMPHRAAGLATGVDTRALVLERPPTGSVTGATRPVNQRSVRSDTRRALVVYC